MFNSETSLEEPLLMLKIYGLLIPGVFHSGGWNSFKVVTQRRGGTLLKWFHKGGTLLKWSYKGGWNYLKAVSHRKVDLF